MRHFPLFLDLSRHIIVVSGSGEAAAAKLRLLLKTRATVRVFGIDTAASVRAWAHEGRLELIERSIQAGDTNKARILYCANDDIVEDRRAAKIGRDDGTLVCIVDNLEESDFITPAIVDRDPVTVAIGTEGTAPVLARKIKAEMEAQLPVELGLLAEEARAFRGQAATLPAGKIRRKFWARFFGTAGMDAFSSGGREGIQECLKNLHGKIGQETAEPGRIVFAGFGGEDPGNLTMNARQAIDQADVILYDRDIAKPILELARREAEFIPRPISLHSAIRTLLQRIEEGHLVCVLLREASLNTFFVRQVIPHLKKANIGYQIHPGIVADTRPSRFVHRGHPPITVGKNKPSLKVG